MQQQYKEIHLKKITINKKAHIQEVDSINDHLKIASNLVNLMVYKINGKILE
jgi:hypothetical protein